MNAFSSSHLPHHGGLAQPSQNQEAKRKGAPMWYVVQVETGREKTACDDIKQAAEDVLDECFVPQYLTGKRRPDGTWIPSKERLFPGYLICVTSQVDELADKL